MAFKKDPSIYDDRGTIGSSEELDEYGVWVKSEPQDILSGEAGEQDGFSDEGLELSGFSGAASEDSLPDFSEFETSDFGDPEKTGGDSGFESFLDEEPAENGEPEDFTESAGFTEGSVNDFLEDSPDLGENTVPAEAPAALVEHQAGDLSTQLLTRIADELASIKKELTSLKQELSSVKKTPPKTQDKKDGDFFDEDDEKIALTGDELNNILNTANFTEEVGAALDAESFDAPDEPIPPEPETADKETGAAELSDKPDIIETEPSDLSGDENSLLSESEISLDEEAFDLGGEIEEPETSEDLMLMEENEETDVPGLMDEEAETSEDIGLSLMDEETDVALTLMDEGTSEDGSLELMDEGSEGIGLIQDDFDVSLDLSESLDEQGVSLKSDSLEEEALALTEEETGDGLDALREEGFTPMTKVEEDTTYLEEDVLASVSEESIDLSDAVIDEPDLSYDITENPIEEPSLDGISIDMDMEEESASEPDISGLETSEENDGAEEMIEIPMLEELVNSVKPEDFVIAQEDDFDTAQAEDASAREALPAPDEAPHVSADDGIPSHLKQELRTVLSYMDQLLESLPEEKIEEFAKSEYFDTYKKLFEELGLA